MKFPGTDVNRGSGIQHIALQTRNDKSDRTIHFCGVPFLPVPQLLYAALHPARTAAISR